MFSPIYNENGTFLGTDDQGLQGDAIIMKQEGFVQNMSHEDALKKDLGFAGLKSVEAEENVNSHYLNLPNRPDYDGIVTLEEANNWYRTNSGQPLFVNIGSVDLSKVYASQSNNQVGARVAVNLFFRSSQSNDTRVLGNITLRLGANNTVRAFDDEYNFEMHNGWNPLNWPRNIATFFGRQVAGAGTPFRISIYGTARILSTNPFPVK
jgi:hypothetical protein